MSFFNKLFKQEALYTSAYDYEKIHRILKNPRVEKDFGLTIRRKKKFLYSLKANWSVGTAQANGVSLSSIAVKLRMENDEQNKIKVWTEPRGELIFIAGLGIPISLIIAVANYDVMPAVYGLGLTLAVFFWFRMVYRLQESNLVEKVEKFLRLRRVE